MMADHYYGADLGRGYAEAWDDAQAWDDAEAWDDPGRDGRPWCPPPGVLRQVMNEDYADADDAAFDDALDAVLDDMSAAEAFNFTKALRQIGRGADQMLSNPAVAQLAGTALQVGAPAAATLVAGPAGTAIGSQLGSLAAGALTRSARPPTPPPPRIGPVMPTFAAPGPVAPTSVAPGPVTASPVAGGSAAAAQGLVLTQMPDVLKALAALAMGQYGARQAGGVPVASVMNMLSQVFGQAAADADELAFLDAEGGGDTGFDAEGELGALSDLPAGRGLYTTLMDVENEEFA